MKQKFTSTIAGASIFISILGLLSRGLGFVREMIFASNFGLETEFDLYLVGAVLPITINTVLLFIGQNFLVPIFQKVNLSNSQESQKHYNQAFILFFSTGILIAFVLFLFSDQIIHIYMQEATSESKELASNIFRIFLITIPFSAGIAMLSALLQTLYEFRYPSISVLFLNISIIIMILLFTSDIGIYVIPTGYLIGTLLQFSYLLVKSRNNFKLNVIDSFRELFLLKSFLGSTLLIILLIESIGQLYSLFDRYFYGQISPGGIASLNYAYIIFLLPISIFSISLATVVFPKITNSISNSSTDELERIYNDSISVNILIFLPITFVFFYFGDTIIKLAFERGKFLVESTAITFTALKCYAVSLVFYSVYSVLNKIFYSINLAKTLLVITLCGILIKLILNHLLVGDYEQYGLAISTTISYLFFFTVSFLIINKKLNIKNRSLFFKDFSFHFINCGLSFIVTFLLANILTISNIIFEIIAILFFNIIYIINLIVLKHRSALMIHQVFQRLNLFGLSKTI